MKKTFNVQGLKFNVKKVRRPTFNVQLIKVQDLMYNVKHKTWNINICVLVSSNIKRETWNVSWGGLRTLNVKRETRNVTYG